MTTIDAPPSTIDLHEAEPAAQSLWRIALRRFMRHRMAVTGLLILSAVVLLVVVGSIVYSEAYANDVDTSIALQAPSAGHIFGTDRVGRDVLARIIYGGQISLLIGIFAMGVSVTLGTIVGALSGYYGGLVDALLMRVTEAMLSIPSLLLLLVMARVFGERVADITVFGRTFSGSVIVIILIIGITSWMYLARIVRSNVLSLKETEFVVAARALGSTNTRIIVSHILPNTLAPIIVAATLGVANAILSEAYISFLGLGVRPPTATWGSMISDAQQFQVFKDAPWMWFFPGLMILLTVMSINFVGDGLRDALDPRADKRV